MSADLALQKAIRQRLSGAAGVIALVPAANILDRNSRPAPDPSIVIGEGQSTEGDHLDRTDQRLFLDLHVWKKEPSLAGVKAIAGAIRKAIHSANIVPVENDVHVGDCRVTSMRYLRDPDGETSHGVVTVEALISEVP